MTSLRVFIESWWTELPHATAARWAGLFFSFHVLTVLLSVAVSQAFLAAATVAYLTHLLRDRPTVNFPPLKLPLLLFCLTTLNSILWSEYPAGGWVALRKLVLFLILLLSVNLVVSARHLGALFRGLFLVAGLAGLAGIVQFVIQYQSVRHYYPGRIYYYMTLTRVQGFMGHWMNFGGQQMLVFSALLAFLLLCHGVIPIPQSRERNLTLLPGGSRRKDQSEIPRCHENDSGTDRRADACVGQAGASPGPTSAILMHSGEPKDYEVCARNDTARHSRGKELYWLAMALVATSLVLTFTRGVWLGGVVATLYIVARWKPRTLWLIPVLFVVAYLAAPSMIRRRVSLAYHPTADASVAIRLEMWHAGLGMIREHPWAGVGPENIPRVYTRYLPPGTTPIYGYHAHLHNNLLQLAAERGLPCLVAWLWFMLALGWNILRIRGRLSSERWVADAAFAAWLAFLAEGFFEYNFGTSPVLMVFLFLMSTPFVAENLKSRALDSNPTALVEQGGSI